jgi:large subunit ribosomal protein L4
MPKLTIYDRKGKKVGTYNVEPTDFAPRINKQLLHDAVVMYQTNLRQGSHQTKSRGMVSGSTKKMYRQKGTGNARVGTRRTNKRKGGGTAKGPKPRDYSYHLPKKAVRAATRMALLSKFQDQETVIIDDLALPEIKTREMAGILKALKLEGTTCLIGTAGRDPVVYKSARNIRGVEVLPASDFNAYAVLRPKRLLLTRAALDELRRKTPAPAPPQT